MNFKGTAADVAVKCKEKVFHNYHFFPCGRKATLDGYCGAHHPDKVAQRQAKQKAKWEEKWNKTTAAWDRKKALEEAHKELFEAAREAVNGGDTMRLKAAVATLDDLTNRT